MMNWKAIVSSANDAVVMSSPGREVASLICKSAINVFTGNKFSCFEYGGLRVFFIAVHPAFCGATSVGFGAVCFLKDGGVTALVACIEFKIAGVATFDASYVNAPDRSKSNNCEIRKRSCFDTAPGKTAKRRRTAAERAETCVRCVATTTHE